MGVDPSTLSKSLQEAIRRAEEKDAAKRKKPVEHEEDVKPCEDTDNAFEGREELLQALCERRLIQRGFWPRIPKYLAAGNPERGWWIHLYSAKSNPYMLDLLVLDLHGFFVEIELKQQKGRISKEQQAILDSNGRLARSFEEFDAILNAFMKKCDDMY